MSSSSGVVQYAGNVLVYGAVSPCDGDWFGGVNEANADAFLHGVISAEVSRLLAHSAPYCCMQFVRLHVVMAVPA